MNEVSEKIQDDIITYMDQYEPPFVLTDIDLESIKDEVCDIVAFHLRGE